MAERKNPIPEPLRRQLDDAHRGLLRVHKALIDHERGRYEQTRGPISGPGEFLQLLINDPTFAWLRPISEFIVQIDEFVSSRTPRDPKEGEALVAQARELLAPSQTGDDLQRNYYRALQESDDVAAAHADWKLSVLQGRREG